MSSRFTASANRFIRLVAIPAVFLIYAGYLAVDRLDVNKGHRLEVFSAKIGNMTELPDKVTALILGGSNAYYSLSARLLDQLDGENWYNFALLNEGFSEQSYHRAIEEQFGSAEAGMAVRTIIYSSILPLRASAINQFESESNDRDVVGGALSLLELRPEWPLDTYLRSQLATIGKPPTVAEAMPDAPGDLDFSAVDCASRVSRGINAHENPNIVLSFYDRTSEFLKRVFSNARIVMVVPSDFIADERAHELWSWRLLALWAERPTHAYEIIVQASIPANDDLCGLTHHANATGREWRTRDLYARLAG